MLGFIMPSIYICSASALREYTYARLPHFENIHMLGFCTSRIYISQASVCRAYKYAQLLFAEHRLYCRASWCSAVKFQPPQFVYSSCSSVPAHGGINPASIVWLKLKRIRIVHNFQLKMLYQWSKTQNRLKTIKLINLICVRFLNY